MPINKRMIEELDRVCSEKKAQWIAVTKLRPIETLNALYQSGKSCFGENKAQELNEKYQQMPSDIEWHFIGHLQSNKVKSIIDKVTCIHSIDSIKLLETIEKEANKLDRNIRVFIQIHVAIEETKYGLSIEEAFDFFRNYKQTDFPHLTIIGLMTMASLTNDEQQIRREFLSVKDLKEGINRETTWNLSELSMGMSSDYKIALECGSTLLRIGSSLYN